MTPVVIPPRPHSLLDEVREVLDQIEARLTRIPGSGPDALEILRLLDQAAERLERLEEAGADTRAERGRLDGAWQGLQRQARTFLREVGPALRAERSRRAGESLRPWWSLDGLYARHRRRVLVRWLSAGGGLLLLLVGGWMAYERFLAPPPQLRQALRHAARGQELLEAGDVAGALAEYEAAAHLTPNDPEMLLRVGVLRKMSGDETGAETAFEMARRLERSQEEFLVRRGAVFLELGDIEAARADAEEAVRLAPEWGHGFYLRASIEAMVGEFEAALADFQRAAELAHAAGDAELEAMARVQIGYLLQRPGE